MIWTLNVPRSDEQTIALEFDEATMQWTCEDELLQGIANQATQIELFLYEPPAVGDLRYVAFNTVARIFDPSQLRFNEEEVIDRRVY